MIKWLKKIICKAFWCKKPYIITTGLGFTEELWKRLKRIEAEMEKNKEMNKKDAKNHD